MANTFAWWGAMIITCCTAGICFSQPSLPQGWRSPTDTDYSDDWERFKQTFPVPFRAQGDLNGDGLTDEVWLLMRTDRDGWGLFAFFGTRTGTTRVLPLETGKDAVQRYGVHLIPPGRYVTSCGRGAYECKTDEPAHLDLKLPAIRFFVYESSAMLYFWDSQSGTMKRVPVDY
jgi:hypothetical protein